MKQLFFICLTATLILSFSCCIKDPCKNVSCGQYGTCEGNGVCSCSDGVTLVNGKCDQLDRADLLGRFFISSTTNSCGGTFPASTPLDISVGGSDNLAVITLSVQGAMQNVKATAKQTSITVNDNQSQYLYTGSGNLSGNNLSLTIMEKDKATNATCTFVFAANR